MFNCPTADDLPRLIHHLGPRYCGVFQDPCLVKFLTYEASTSLNMFLATLATKVVSGTEISPLVKAVREGLGIEESAIVFAISPSSVRDDIEDGGRKTASIPSTPSSAFFLPQTHKQVRTGAEQTGDVFAAYVSCLDMALWKVGGAAIALRLVQIANVSDARLSTVSAIFIVVQSPHELSRALGILTDGLRNSWQNSEDMERLRKPVVSLL